MQAAYPAWMFRTSLQCWRGNPKTRPDVHSSIVRSLQTASQREVCLLKLPRTVLYPQNTGNQTAGMNVEVQRCGAGRARLHSL